jgi:hypothetical protein
MHERKWCAPVIVILSLLLGCGGRPVGELPETEPALPPNPASGPAAQGVSGCEAPAQLVAAGVSIDGSVSTVQSVRGWVGKASSGAPPGGQGFANHHLEVLYELEAGEEVRVGLALDRLLAIGEEIEIDTADPSPGGLAIDRAAENGVEDGLSSVGGDTFSGWARVARTGADAFSASFCLLAWRGSTPAAFSWARVSLPLTIFISYP